MFFDVKELTFSELRTALAHVENHHKEAVAFNDTEAATNAVLLLHDLQLQLNRRMKGRK